MSYQSQRNLLTILKAALLGKPIDAEDFTTADWKAIYRLAKEQAVLALCTDGISRLPKGMMPMDEANREKWITAMMNTERRNLMQNERVVRLANELRLIGLHPVLMKGQSLGVEYSKPLHRTCGDIDLYFKEEGEVEKAVEWAKAHGKGCTGQHEHDYPFMWNGETVELHYWMALLYNKRYNQALQRIIREEYKHEAPNIVNVGGSGIETVPVTLYVMYQIVHISFHFLNEGIGLRQFCDLALYLRNHHDEIDFPKLNGWIKELGMERLADLYATFLCKKLGLDAALVQWKTDSPYLDVLYEDIFVGGNFGKLRFGFKGRSSFLVQKIKALPLHWHNYRRYHALWPKETTASFVSKWKRAALGIK